MAQMANVYVPAGAGGTTLEFESLANVVEMVAKEETPCYSNMRKVEATAIKEEWGTEDIGTVAVPTPREIGFVAAPTAALANRRLDNYLELVAEEGSVSHTMQRMKAAGSVNTYEHQKLKRGILLRRKLNKLMLTPQAKDGTMPDPQLATVHAYIAANFLSVAGTPGATPTGNGTDIPGAGTTPDVFDTIVPIDTVLQAAISTRGQPSAMYLSPKMKGLFSKLPDASVADNQVNMTAPGRGGFNHVGAVDKYLSDYGILETIMDIDAPNTGILILDHDYVEVAILPGMDMNDYELGKRGSGREFMIEWQGTVIVPLPEAHAYVNGYAT